MIFDNDKGSLIPFMHTFNVLILHDYCFSDIIVSNVLMTHLIYTF